MAVKIKLMRLGRIRQPYYRIVVADARTRRNGKAIETIGKYHPKEQPSLIEVDSERVQYWLGVGAQPTEPVQHILQVTGDWQRFKGLAGAEGTLQRAEPKLDKAELFNRALAQAGEVPTTEATTPRKKPTRAAADTGAAAQKANADTAPSGGAAQTSTGADDREDSATAADGQV
ncbi:MAG: 30S ribosomal protein S16 [Catenulispora sp. 13_1_20CM_3_70_7]|nr:MAG: 30S ribosomal protein S16 [Catenulispora sp. 13_1_20CM_3_70_7]